jgi:hypothetical protein
MCPIASPSALSSSPPRLSRSCWEWWCGPVSNCRTPNWRCFSPLQLSSETPYAKGPDASYGVRASQPIYGRFGRCWRRLQANHFGRLFLFTGYAQDGDDVFTIWFSEGGTRLAERQWPIVPRVGETITLHDSAGLFEVIRVHWQEYDDATRALVAQVSVRSATS